MSESEEEDPLAVAREARRRKEVAQGLHWAAVSGQMNRRKDLEAIMAQGTTASEMARNEKVKALLRRVAEVRTGVRCMRCAGAEGGSAGGGHVCGAERLEG